MRRPLAALDLPRTRAPPDEVESGAAVLLRDHDPEQAELGHALDHAHVELVLDVVLDRVGEHFPVDEVADGVLDQALLVSEPEVHAGGSVRVADGATIRLTDESIKDGSRDQIEEPIATQTGISFALTDEQRELRRLAREFAEKEIRPKAAEYDEHQTHPADIVAKAHEVGLMNPHIQEEYGGLGLPGFDGTLAGRGALRAARGSRSRSSPTRSVLRR